MSNTAYIGSGTTLSSKYYLRSFYRSDREAGTSSKRREFSGNQLALADGRALRKAVRRLTSSDFSDDQGTNTRNSVPRLYPDLQQHAFLCRQFLGPYLGAQCKAVEKYYQRILFRTR